MILIDLKFAVDHNVKNLNRKQLLFDNLILDSAKLQGLLRNPD